MLWVFHISGGVPKCEATDSSIKYWISISIVLSTRTQRLDGKPWIWLEIDNKNPYGSTKDKMLWERILVTSCRLDGVQDIMTRWVWRMRVSYQKRWWMGWWIFQAERAMMLRFGLEDVVQSGTIRSVGSGKGVGDMKGLEVESWEAVTMKAGRPWGNGY